MPFDFDLNRALSQLSLLLVAYALAIPVGWNRETRARSAGLRTFPLVAVGACAYMLVGLSFLASDDAYARVIYGLITGIGFVGGGAILKEKGSVRGTATAASIWNTGAVGMAVALQRIEIAVLLSALNFATLRFGRSLKERANEDDEPKDDD